MKLEKLHDLLDQNPQGLQWQGKCHDCRRKVTVTADAGDDGIHIAGGGVYELDNGRIYLKCDRCLQAKPRLTHFQKCEVYARVVGYLRPIDQWNPGKRAEFEDRKAFGGSGALDDTSNAGDVGPDDYLLLHEK